MTISLELVGDFSAIDLRDTSSKISDFGFSQLILTTSDIILNSDFDIWDHCYIISCIVGLR